MNSIRNRRFPSLYISRGTGRDFLVLSHGYVAGREYGTWIDSVSGSARNEGHAAGDLIEIPSSIVESILREEIFVERDLSIVDLVTTDTPADIAYIAAGQREATADFYNYCSLYNVTRSIRKTIADYTSPNMVINEYLSTWAEGDKVFLTNIQGDSKINYASFDVLGNTTNGLRKDWKFGRSIHEEVYAGDLLDSLLFEARCILFTTYNQYKIKALDAATEDGTWTKPMIQAGNLMASAGLTHISQLYNDYRINYHFDYGSQEYKKTLFVNKSGYTSTLTNGAADQTICANIFNNYHILQKFEYNCDWIYDDTTAELFFDKIFAWYSKQRLIVNWAGSVEDYITYEVGDQVILNNTSIIPTGINNVSKFMIMENPLLPIPGAPVINFRLIEVS